MENTIFDNTQLLSPEFIKQKEYWKKKLSGDIILTSFISESHNNQTLDEKYHVAKISIEEKISNSILKLGKNSDISIFILLLSALKTLVAHYTSLSDIITKIPCLPSKNEHKIINNCVFIRIQIDKIKTFRELLFNVKDAVVEAYNNQDYPNNKLIEYLFENNENFNNCISDIAIMSKNIHPEFSENNIKGNIFFEFKREDNSIGGIIHYNPGKFKNEFIYNLVKHFKNILKEIIKDIDINLSSIDLLTDQDKYQILYSLNNTEVEFPYERTIHELFINEANISPHSIALINKDNFITYNFLNKISNQLANKLITKGIKNETVVCIIEDRSPEIIVGMLSILKAGGTYLPIDPEFPEKRIEFIINDSNSNLIITSKNFVPKFNIKKDNIIVLDQKINEASDNNIELKNNATDAAYLMYTSGSTGKPKGVIINHRSVIRLVKNANYVELNSHTRILQTGASVFDASTFEIWGSLLNGGILSIIDKNEILDVNFLKAQLKKNLINTLWLSSPLFNQLIQQDEDIFFNLKYLLVGGDVLSPKHINRVRYLNHNLKVINGYGPTENTTFSACYFINKTHLETIPIGKPISNSTAYVFNKYLKLTPINLFGNLYVGGKGVARGYLNNPELTHDKFISNPYIKGDILYKTGDLAKWNYDGDIEFLCRDDYQVKIRGFRVEPGEIENKIKLHHEVKDAKVLIKKDNNEEKYVCGYYTSYHENEIPELKDFLKKELPDFMIPSFLFHLEIIPLNQNGKIDINALPEPSLLINNDYIPPQTKIESTLANVWSEILWLEKEQIGLNSNFFEIGGHSLNATILASRINKTFNIKIPLKEIFALPKLSELANFIRKAELVKFRDIKKCESKEYYPLSFPQRRLYHIYQLNPQNISYNIPQVVTIEGNLQKDKLENIFKELIKRHENFRTCFISIDGIPQQIILEKVEFQIDHFKTNEDEVKNIITKYIRPFLLEKAPLIRVALLEITFKKFILIVDIHHIISDGFSQENLLKEFFLLYNNQKLNTLRIQYKDFSEWQNKTMITEKIKEQENYWLKKLDGKLPRLRLPLDFPRSNMQNFKGKDYELELKEELCLKVKELLKENEITLYIFFLAVFNVLLSKYSNQEDILIGSPVAGRRHADLDHIQGMFVGQLVMRNNPSKEKSFVQFLNEVKMNAIEAYDNQDYSFEILIQKLKLQGEKSRNPLFDVVFSVTNRSQELSQYFKNIDLNIMPYNYGHNTSKTDLRLGAIESGERIGLIFTYAITLFNKETIEIMGNRFIEIIQQVADNPQIKIKDIKISQKLTSATDVILQDEMGDFSF